MNEKVSFYHTYACRSTVALSDAVAKDLNLDEFFQKTDCTTSYIGKQYLYHLLYQDTRSEVWKHEDVITAFSKDHAWREDIRKSLARTKDEDACYICSLFSSEIRPVSKKWINAAGILRFLPLCWMMLAFVAPHPVWIYLLVVNLIMHFLLHYQNKKNIYQHYHSIPQTIRMLRQAEELSKDERLKDLYPTDNPLDANKLNAFRRQLLVFNLGVKLDGDFALLAYTLMELVNVFFLGEYYAVNKSLLSLHREKKWLETIFLFVGMTDVLCSLSFLREQLPFHCTPANLPNPGKLMTENVYHPLVEKAVPNSLTMNGKSALITGSNMCGKTCFIRTIGLNLLAAKTLNTCYARSFAMHLDTRLLSSIHHTDKLTEGKSLFLQEALDILHMLKEADKGPCLFLIDEPFGGTNSAERIAIGTSVLEKLAGNGHIVLATTHDWELQHELEEKYDCYHFTEQVGEKDLTFDYRLRKGKTAQGNAVKILRVYGYPEEVVRRAKTILENGQGHKELGYDSH